MAMVKDKTGAAAQQNFLIELAQAHQTRRGMHHAISLMYINLGIHTVPVKQSPSGPAPSPPGMQQFCFMILGKSVRLFSQPQRIKAIVASYLTIQMLLMTTTPTGQLRTSGAVPAAALSSLCRQKLTTHRITHRISRLPDVIEAQHALHMSFQRRCILCEDCTALGCANP